MSKWTDYIHYRVKRRRDATFLPPKGPENDAEATKVVMSNSMTKAIRRCLIHALPISTTVLIVVINVNGIFVGSDFTGPIKSQTINLMLLQVAAKVHELMIVASLSLIILQMVRHELLFGDGLPLGLIGSGLTFSDIGFFFKKDFYGALRYVAKGNAARKIGFIAILILCGLTAALAGPASATLLVPKTQTWPSGGTAFYLNGSSEDFWPNDLSEVPLALKSLCAGTNTSDLSICPAAGFQFLWEHWGRMTYNNFYQQDVRPYAKDLSGSEFYWPVQSPDSTVPPLYALGDFRKDNLQSSNTFLVQPHAAVSALLQRIADDWWHALIEDQKMDANIIDDRQISALLVRSPIASVRCSEPQNLTSMDQTIHLPRISSRFTYSTPTELNVTTFRNQSADHLRFSWIHLPDIFGAASIGGIFESPWTFDNGTRVVIGCTTQLGWIPTTLFTDEYTFWSGWYPWDLRFGDRTPAFTDVPPGVPLSPTDGRIAIGDDWLDLLTPIAASLGSNSPDWQPTTMESILLNAGFNDIPKTFNGSDMTDDWLNTDSQGLGKTSFLEAIIASVLVDGLSRTGSHRIFKTSDPPAQWSPTPYEPRPDFNQRLLANSTAFITPTDISPGDLTTLRVDMVISGFSFRGSLAGYLSIAVLLTHLIMASTHTVWVLFHRHSSWSWSSIAELIALAQNSTPATAALQRTGAGIEKAITYARVAKIRVRTDPTCEVECVELVFMDEHAGAPGCMAPLEEAVAGVHELQRKASVAGPDNGRLSRHLGTAATWPREQHRKQSRPPEIQVAEITSRSSSTERLVPRAYHPDNRTWEVVKINQPYA